MASAQTLTLYGIADLWMGTSQVKTGASGTRQNVVDTSGISGSRFGVRGVEDLGGGLLASFVLENGFDLSTGVPGQGGLLFGRQAYVGLQGSWGSVQAGRLYSPYDELFINFRQNYSAFTFESDSLTANNGIPDYSYRLNNAVAYTTPLIGGFSAKVLQSFGENKNLPTVGNKSTDAEAVALKYVDGPFTVGYAYQQEKQANGDANKYQLFGALYDFGFAKLMASYNPARNDMTKDKEYQIGAIVPFGPAYAVSLGYTHSKSKAGALTSVGKGFAVIGSYDISKRTRLYAAMVDASTHPNNVVAETVTTKYGVGIRHAF
ncbi:hypothetical protein RD110_05230 [Rhodoferax koreense]|uniref:Porin domain-containing protein n=2 Tax=Rhodoferax koreensis TaxID=1842727 RepID=A0A1P8JSD7_9BURK|nr:hypothetical protein RD110_05230 [Rhodoferax koreense]